jgi:hypothetical protein
LPYGVIYGHLRNFLTIWYIFSGFGLTHEEKSGNPDSMWPIETGDKKKNAHKDRQSHKESERGECFESPGAGKGS